MLVLLLSYLTTASAVEGHGVAARKDANPNTDRTADSPPHSPDTKSARPDVGTKDAPVDGMDGKPHAGPFVDPLDPLWHPPESSRKVKQSDNLKLPTSGQPPPGDGVMNDPHRKPPRKGTTGTEGGVTEKDRDRKIHEINTGEKMMQKPDSPKAPSSLDDRNDVLDTKDGTTKEAKLGDKPMDVKADPMIGVAGLEVHHFSNLH